MAKKSKRTPAKAPEDSLFADAPGHAREALALHKAERRRQQRAEFQQRQSS